MANSAVRRAVLCSRRASSRATPCSAKRSASRKPRRPDLSFAAETKENRQPPIEYHIRSHDDVCCRGDVENVAVSVKRRCHHASNIKISRRQSNKLYLLKITRARAQEMTLTARRVKRQAHHEKILDQGLSMHRPIAGGDAHFAPS